VNIKVSGPNPLGEYEAIDDDTYDAEVIDCQWHSSSPVGYGKTKEAAIADLMEQIEERKT
jgi:hypothetical protein